MVFESVYEVTDVFTTVRKQRIWCWFDGNAIHARWNNFDAGAGSSAMLDCICGGFRTTTSTTVSQRRGELFNSIQHYSETASVAIGVTRNVTGATIQVIAGFNDGNQSCWFSGSNDNAMYMDDTGVLCNKTLINSQACAGFTAVCTCVARDTNFTGWKVEMNACDDELTLCCSACVAATGTIDLPGEALQPAFGVLSRACAARSMDMRYFEAYNK